MASRRSRSSTIRTTSICRACATAFRRISDTNQQLKTRQIEHRKANGAALVLPSYTIHSGRSPRERRSDNCGRSGPAPEMFVQTLRALSASLIASCFVTLLCLSTLHRAAAPSIGKLRKLALQGMPASSDSRHVVDELPYLAR